MAAIKQQAHMAGRRGLLKTEPRSPYLHFVMLSAPWRVWYDE
ncbi:hypothetical protein BN137_2396 [Cronobacter condimenti 1330]|uniref:Uncharacterized protein n=1 Tax=Cronobacter condimenti 1330 TaxID=1073999 RepID=K8A1R6_9ENTR|nr:hypothetical protein BN137_2396 [Cronobacter condimenti 1330]